MYLPHWFGLFPPVSLVRSPDLAYCLLSFREGVKLELVCQAWAESSPCLECWWVKRDSPLSYSVAKWGEGNQVDATGATFFRWSHT